MSIILYYGSGSSFAWRAQLALEHKALPYALKVLSFSAGDTRKPEFLALNPRHQVPVLVDGDFTLYESGAIAEYLEDAYPERGAPLFPRDIRDRAIARRMVLEASLYLPKAAEPIWSNAFSRSEEERVPQEIGKGREAFAAELALFARAKRGDFLAGPLSAADYAVYSLVAFTRRCELKLPELNFAGLLPAEMAQWMRRVEALPYFDKCYPPHWKNS